MRITFERTGGVAGMRLAASFDLEGLPPEKKAPLEAALKRLDLSNLPVRQAATSQPDQFEYTITVEAEDGRHSMVTGDSGAPAEVQELIQLLSRMARSQAGKK